MLKFFSKCIVITALTMLFVLFFSQNKNKEEIINNENHTITEDIYLVKAEENFVFLYKNNKPIKKYDIDIQLLPGSDIKRLTEGIRVSSEHEADRLAEDYDG